MHNACTRSSGSSLVDCLTRDEFLHSMKKKAKKVAKKSKAKKAKRR